MKSSDIEIVRGLPLFREVEPRRFSSLVSGAFLQRFPANLGLVREGVRPDFLHIVVEGLVELYSSVNDREIGVMVVGPVSAFVLAAVIMDAPYLNSARTLTSANILMIPAEQVRLVFGQDEHFARAIVQELASAYRVSIKKLKGQMGRTGVERLANWILLHLTRRGEGGSMTIPLDRTTLAAHLGTTRENLSRNFTQLALHGVHTKGREIEVDDIERLAAFARPNPLIDDPLS
jgi:CRP/FNR family transcriptional activator FtrB